jgi:GNAT superfamily N-acetyltransferase
MTAFVGPEEAAAVREVMLAAFEEYRGVLVPPSSAHAETMEDTAAALAQGGGVLVREGGHAVASGRYQLRDGYIYIGRISVLPSHRGRGLAIRVMEALHDRARQLGYAECRLGTRSVLQGNVRLYERLGYEVTSVEPHPKQPTSFITEMRKLLD